MGALGVFLDWYFLGGSGGGKGWDGMRREGGMGFCERGNGLLWTRERDFVDGRKGGRPFKLLEGKKEKEKEKEAVVFWSCVYCTTKLWPSVFLKPSVRRNYYIRRSQSFPLIVMIFLVSFSCQGSSLAS